MNIFVTGGGGYVGSSLVPRLLDEGHKVTVYDLMIYGDDVLNTCLLYTSPSPRDS